MQLSAQRAAGSPAAALKSRRKPQGILRQKFAEVTRKLEGAGEAPRASATMETTQQAPVATIREIGKFDGQTVTIQGWLYNLRESGKLLFPIFRDGSGIIQGVLVQEERFALNSSTW